MSVWAIVVAAGGGTRFGGEKQFEVLGDRRVLDWAVAAAIRSCDHVVVVVPADRAAGADGLGIDVDAVVAGAETRSGSVRAGLTAVADDAEIVVIHDAARPRAADSLFAAVIEAVRAGADAAVPGVPVADTLKRVDGDVVVATVDRTDLVAVQTPQAFSAPVLRRAHRSGPSATDDAALVELVGGRVVVVPGDPRNLKITNTQDLAVMRSSRP